MSDPKEKMLNKLRNLDYGFCNPIKARMADEDAADLRASLREHGLDDHEIDAALRDDG